MDYPQYLNKLSVPDHLTFLLRNLVQVKKQQLEPDMEQQIGSKLGEEYVKAVCCHPVYLSYMQQQNRPTLAGPPAPGVLGPVYSRPTIHARTPKHPLCS